MTYSLTQTNQRYGFKVLCGYPIPKKGALHSNLARYAINRTAFLHRLYAGQRRDQRADCDAFVKNEPLVRVFEEIRRQARLRIPLQRLLNLQRAGPVTIDLKNAPVEEVLALIFRDQPLMYTIIDKRTIVVEAEANHGTSVRGFSSPEDGKGCRARYIMNRVSRLRGVGGGGGGASC